MTREKPTAKMTRTEAFRTIRRAHATKLLPSPKAKGEIVNALLKLKNSGLKEQTERSLENA